VKIDSPFSETEITIDLSLEKYKDMDLFPEKTAKANEILQKVDLPKDIKKT